MTLVYAFKNPTINVHIIVYTIMREVQDYIFLLLHACLWDTKNTQAHYSANNNG